VQLAIAANDRVGSLVGVEREARGMVGSPGCRPAAACQDCDDCGQDRPTDMGAAKAEVVPDMAAGTLAHSAFLFTAGIERIPDDSLNKLPPGGSMPDPGIGSCGQASHEVNGRHSADLQPV
jgi:hypothetical protein